MRLLLHPRVDSQPKNKASSPALGLAAFSYSVAKPPTIEALEWRLALFPRHTGLSDRMLKNRRLGVQHRVWSAAECRKCSTWCECNLVNRCRIQVPQQSLPITRKMVLVFLQTKERLQQRLFIKIRCAAVGLLIELQRPSYFNLRPIPWG